MRFILGLIFFALLFYAIHVYFPDTFDTLVTWTGNVFNFVKDGIETIIQKISGSKSAPDTGAAPKALLSLW